tara:strand:- start:135 stop:896 length:762 start_codon:yes stop_codon:yes gene_type:complete
MWWLLRIATTYFTSIKDYMMSKQKEIGASDLAVIKPVTDSQQTVFDTWKEGKNQFLFGCAGTGKTFVSLYLALQQVLKNETPYDKVIVVRSLIPTREIGFLPGDEEDKAALYQVPYANMMQFMFEQPNEQAFSMLYDRLKSQGSFYFMSTSFLRGLTFDNSIIIVDECQNLNFHELDTIVTRVGQDSKIFFCGDFGQSDLTRLNERNGLMDFLQILHEMDEFNCTEFNIGDIVRSGFVRSYLIQKTKLGMGIE